MQSRNLWRRQFSLAFAGTMLLFSLLAAGAVFVAAPPGIGGTAGRPQAQYLPTADEALRAVFTLGEEGGIRLLVDFSPHLGRVAVTPLSAVGETPPADRSFALDDAALAALIDRFGAIDLRLPIRVEVEGTVGAFTLAPGRHRLSGTEIAALLRAYPGGEAARTRLAAEVFAAGINQHFGQAAALSTDELYAQLTQGVDCDLTYDDLARRMQALRFVSCLQGGQLAVLLPEENMGDKNPPAA